MITRYSEAIIRADLEEKMVFVTGPRQIGKTTLAKQILPDAAGYLSWDIPDQRAMILRREIPAVDTVVLDDLLRTTSLTGRGHP